DTVFWLLLVEYLQLVKAVCTIGLLVCSSQVCSGWKKTKRWKWKLGRRKPRSIVPAIRKQQQPRRSICIASQPGFDYYTETGLFLDQFETLFDAVEPLLNQPRGDGRRRCCSTLLESRTRLIVALNWLREGGTYRRLMRVYSLPNRAF